MEDSVSLCVGVQAFGSNRETHSKQIRKRGLYEEATGPEDSTQVTSLLS